MDGVRNWGPVDVRWSGLARALGFGPFGGLVIHVLRAKGTVKAKGSKYTMAGKELV